MVDTHQRNNSTIQPLSSSSKAITTCPFKEGQVYKRSDIHKEFGGSPMHGIVTLSNYLSWIFIFFNTASDQVSGYANEYDGSTLKLRGEGKRGDMQLTKANKALANHLKDGKQLFIFSYHKEAKDQKKAAPVTFRGNFILDGYDEEQRPDNEGELRREFIFNLVKEGGENLEVDIDELPTSDNSQTLREHAYKASNPEVRINPEKKYVIQQYRNRSAAVKNYALNRAKGKCEYCKQDAPFKTKAGKPYLEVHHITRLTDGGLDDPRHIASICPNCHREAHHSDRTDEIREQLLDIVTKIEAAKDNSGNI